MANAGEAVRRAWVAAFVAAHAQANLTGIGEKEIPLREEAITFQHEMVPFTQARGLRARHPVENLQPSPLLYPVDPPM
jgi:hypothetical protein